MIAGPGAELATLFLAPRIPHIGSISVSKAMQAERARAAAANAVLARELLAVRPPGLHTPYPTGPGMGQVSKVKAPVLTAKDVPPPRQPPPGLHTPWSVPQVAAPAGKAKFPVLPAKDMPPPARLPPGLHTPYPTGPGMGQADLTSKVESAIQSGQILKSTKAMEALADAIEAGGITVKNLTPFKALGLGDAQLAQFIRENVKRLPIRSRLNLNRLRKDLEKAGLQYPNLAKVIEELPPLNTGQRLVGAFKSMENFRRSMMIGQMVTTARNYFSQAGRVGINIAEDVLEGTINSALTLARGGRPLVEGMPPISRLQGIKQAFIPLAEDIKGIPRYFGQRLPLEDALESLAKFGDVFIEEGIRPINSIMKVLRHYPRAMYDLTQRPLEGMLLGNKFSRLVNVPNRLIEMSYRKYGFDIRLRTNLRLLGHDVDNMSDDAIKAIFQSGKGTTLQRAVDDAVSFSLEQTFAQGSRDLEKVFGVGAILSGVAKLGNNPAFTALVNPYPRFYANALKFLTEYSPLGFYKLAFGPKTLAALDRGAPEILARAVLGTSMLTAAMVSIEGLDGKFPLGIKAGELPAEVIFNNGGRDLRVDLRPFEPLSAYFALAKALWHPDEIFKNPDDYLRLAVGMERLGQTGGFPIIDVLRGLRDPHIIANALARFLGGYAGSFFTPGRMLRDIIVGAESVLPESARELLQPEQEAIQRTTRTEPWLGPIKTRLPYLSRQLPPFRSPVRATAITSMIPFELSIPGLGVIKLNAAAVKQLSGFTVREDTPAQIEVNRLYGQQGFRRFSPAPTANRELDQLNLAITGAYSEPVIQRFALDVPAYQMAPDELKRMWLISLHQKMRQAARQYVTAQRPDLAVPEMLKSRLGPEGRELLESMKPGTLESIGPLLEPLATPGFTSKMPEFEKTR